MTLLLVDWVALLNELRHAGFNTSQVAARTQIPRSTINEYRQGSNSPSHVNGETLIGFWCLVSMKPRAAVPLQRVVEVNVGLVPTSVPAKP